MKDRNKAKPSAPRNHVVIALMRRGSGQGAHDKTEKARRRNSKMELRKSSGFILNYSVLKKCTVLSNKILGSSQVVKTTGFDPVMRWFDSNLPSQFTRG